MNARDKDKLYLNGIEHGVDDSTGITDIDKDISQSSGCYENAKNVIKMRADKIANMADILIDENIEAFEELAK